MSAHLGAETPLGAPPMKGLDAPGVPARSLGLDLARCLAILLLLLAHVGQTMGSPLGGFFGIYGFYWASLGGVAVTVFLVISGWALELSYGGRSLNYGQFVARRVLRILPVYYLALLFGVLVFVLTSVFSARPFESHFTALGMADIPLSLTGTYGFAGKWGGPFLATSWFIGLIMAMYLLFPLLSPAVKRRPLLTLGFLLLVSCSSRVILGHFGVLPNRPLDWFPLCRVFEFSLGIWLGDVLSKRKTGRVFSLGRLDPYIEFGAALSFPLFLVHYPILPLITWLTGQGVNFRLAIGLFLTLSGLVAWIIVIIDRRIPRSKIEARITPFLSRNRQEPTPGSMPT